MNDYQTPRSYESTPVTNGSQTTPPSMPVDERQTPRHHADDACHHADDARHHDGTRGHPYYRPHAAHVNEHDRYGYAAAPDENTRHGQAGGDMLQRQTFEPRGYGGQPLLSREVLSEVEFRGILDRDQEAAFGLERQTTYSRSLNLVGDISTEFAPTYGSLTMRHNSTRIEHPDPYRPPHVATTGYQTYSNVARGNTSPHRPSSASTASSTSIRTIDAPYELSEVVNANFGHSFAAPAPAPMQCSANQYQDVFFPSANRMLSLQQPQRTPVNVDAPQATIYGRSSNDNLYGSFSQQGHVYDTGFGMSGPQAPLGLDYTGTDQCLDSQRASICHSTAAHAQVAYDPSFENDNLDPRQCSVSPSGRQQEHAFGLEGLPPYDHRGAHHRFLYDAGPVQTLPAHEFPLWTAREAGDPLANSALGLAQLAHHREVVPPSRPRSMIAHDDLITAYPTLNLGHSPIANPFYEFRYDATEGAARYRTLEQADGPSPYTFPQGTFFRRAYVPSYPQATNRGLSLWYK